MTPSDTITLFHSPQTRSSASLTLLEELKLPYELHLINMKAGDQRKPAYMAINPMGKVPAIWHRGQLITEQVAVYLYLADLATDAHLAPALNDPLRGPYLRWMAFYAACYEPAIVDRALKREAGPLAMSPYGDFDTMWGTLVQQLSATPYLLGDKFSAADMLWGMALHWGTMFGIVPDNPVVKAYVDSIASRASCKKIAGQDVKWAAEFEAAVNAEKAA